MNGVTEPSSRTLTEGSGIGGQSGPASSRAGDATHVELSVATNVLV